MTAKILLLDIETAPSLAYVWKFWQENISPKQVIEHPTILSFAAKWLKMDAILYHENRGWDDYEIVNNLVFLLNSADIVIAHNGDKFDLPKIRSRAIVNGIHPPSPFKSIDTYLVAKKEFGFPSNSLEYLSNVMGCKHQKGGHKKFPGFELWLECLRDNNEAWEELKEYNIQDVLVLEELYLKMLPWISNHPTISIFEGGSDEEKILCPRCGSDHIQWRGYTYTNVSRYKRFKCMDCGGWSRTRYNENRKNVNLLRA